MKKMLLALLALVVSVSMWGADVTGALTGVVESKITYQSVDVSNNAITLSAKIYYKSQAIKFVVLNCHPTITHNAGCPTGTAPQMEAIKYMVSEDALVVCPDYLGFGDTRGSVHPYMCSTLTARNVLDACKAAIAHVTTTGARTMSPTYYTINVGYSQGGATALAFHKYMETEATEADRKLVNLKGSVCGAGPYSQNIVFNEYEKMASLDYPIYLLYCLQGHKEAFGETTMKDLSLEECFTPEFWAACQGDNGFLAMLNAKETNVDDLNSELKKAGFTSFASIINADYADHDSKVYRIIQKTLNNSNLLKEDGWTPTRQIIFYHDKAGHDIVVPYACTEAAMERFGNATYNGRQLCTYVDAIEDYGYDVTFTNIPFLGQVATTDKENYLWHAAVFNEVWVSATKYPLQNTVGSIASATGMSGYKFNDLDHRTFGARFYAQFLAVRAKLRPSQDVDDPTMPSTIVSSVPTSLAVAANATSVDGSYDRITTAMPYAIPAGKPVFLQFAAPVDGYYFGADAPRYEVTLNADGEAVSYEEMADDADFEAGKVYLVTSEREETAPVVSMTAGVKTATVASDLAWRELNIRKLNVLGGTSYASAYMPFAYTGDLAYTVSGELNGNKEVTLTATQQKSIPVGTGVLLIDDDAATSVVLSPATKGLANAEISDNILSGTYTAMDNDYEKYLLFGKCTHTPAHVGFFPSYSALAIKSFSAFIDRGTHAAKGYELSWGEDAILRVVAQGKSQVIYGMDGAKRSTMQQGVNIIRMEDGSVRKVINK